MRFFTGLLLLLASTLGLTATLDIRVPMRAGNEQPYYRELLTQAFGSIGITLRLNAAPELPNRRADAMLENGDLDLYWYIRTQARDQRLLLIDQPLTYGMIGKRILMVPPSELSRYSHIRTLQQLRDSKAVAAMGMGWADVRIWRFNLLPVRELATSSAGLYKQVSLLNRGVNYFSRGSIEIEPENGIHAGLAVEPHLLLSYPGDFYFYLSPKRADLKQQLEKALQQAEKSGLRERLFKQSYGPALSRLNMEKRTIIPLQTPP